MMLAAGTLPISRAMDLVSAASGKSIVSLDLFDTLLYRELRRPDDLFLVQRAVAHEFLSDISGGDWLTLRKKAEHQLAKHEWPREITLDQIYKNIGSDRPNLRPWLEQLRNVELECERKVIKPFAEAIDAVGQLQAEGKKLLIVTDTYLPECFIRELIGSFFACDYLLLCSSAIGKTKRSGELLEYLASQFKTDCLVHFGDNPHSDIAMAKKAGVRAHRVMWARNRFLLQNDKPAAAMVELGFHRIRTPFDAPSAEFNKIDSLRLLAWYVSIILSEFLRAADLYAQEIRADEVWFLSRDCETIFKVAQASTGLFSDRRIRYVYASRSSCYPMMALSDAGRFRDWMKRSAEPSDIEKGEAAREYYRSLIEPRSKRLLLIDVGWKGRLQVAIGDALGVGVQTFGFYFSLEPHAEALAKSNSREFVDWDLTTFDQATIESVFGFEGPSCDFFTKKHDVVECVFRTDENDRAPAGYCGELQESMSFLINHNPNSKEENDLVLGKLIRDLCMFPTEQYSKALSQWVIGLAVGGATVRAFSSARAAPVQAAPANVDVYLPTAIWDFTDSPTVARLVQYFCYGKLRFRDVRRRVKAKLRCLIRK